MGFFKWLVKRLSQEKDTAEKELRQEIKVNVPNIITLLRLVFAFVFVYMLFSNYNNIALTIIFAIAALTDFFDGFFARRLNQKSKFGALFDQIVDRIFTGIIVISLIIYLIVYRKAVDNIFLFSAANPFLLLFLTISREIIGFPGVIIGLVRKKPVYHVKYIGKLTTFFQSIALGAIILNMFPILTIILSMLTCLLGILAGFDYLKHSIIASDKK